MSHPLWNPADQNMTLHYVGDFLNRSKTMLQGLPRLPEAEQAECYTDVLGRCTLTKILVTDTTGKTAMMTGGDPSRPLDFGADVKAKVEAVLNTFP